MSELLTMQDLANGHLDVKALGEAANGDENTIVTTRTGNTYPSAERAINIMFQNGGLPATPFATKALMTASSLSNDRYAMVTDGGADNGLYVKADGNWVKSDYDPVLQAKTYADAKISDASEKLRAIDLDYFPLTYQYPDPTTLEWRTAAEYLIGSIVPVELFSTYEVTASENPAFIYLMESDEVWKEANRGQSRPLKANRHFYIAPNQKKQVYIPSNIKFMYVIKKLNTYDMGSIRTPKSIVELSLGHDASKATKKDLTFVNDKLSELADYAGQAYKEQSEFKLYPDILGIHGGLYPKTRENVEYYNAAVKSARVQLSAGDILDFAYEQIRAPILWEVVSVAENTAYPILLTTDKNPNAVKNHRYVATKTVTLDISGYITGSIRVNNNPATFEDLGAIAYWTAGAVDEETPSKNFKMSTIITLKKGDTVKVENVGKGHIPILFDALDNEFFYGGVSVPPDYAFNDLIWTADSDVKIKVSYPISGTLLIQRPKTIDDTLKDFKLDILQNLPSGGGSTTAPPLPPLAVNEFRNPMILPELEYVFATFQNFILKTETVDGIEYIALSSNLGKTWTFIENQIGDIVSYHFFSDNTIMLCSPTAVWYSSNHTSFTKSVVYDVDGSVFIPTQHHFFSQQHGNRQMFVGDKEMFVWGEYVMGNPHPRIWYTTDFGRTIKCAVKFNQTTMDGIVPIIRHVHDMVQDRHTDTFYLTTGDGTGTVYTENYFFSATYDVATDKFTWKKLGEGPAFKLGKLFFDETYIYFLSDYTPDTGLSADNGLYRVAKKHASDITKYSAIWKVNPAEWGAVAPFRLVMDRNGNKVILLDWIGQGILFIATDGLNFRKAFLNKGVLLSYVIGENYNGDIYCVTNNRAEEMGIEANFKLSGGTYNLTRLLQENGVPNFMRGNILVNNYNNAVG